MTAAETELRRQLERLRDAWPRGQAGLHYRGPADFVLRHGTWFKPAPYPYAIPPGLPKGCYGNSLYKAVAHGLRYIEGYMLMPHVLGAGEEKLYVLDDPALGLIIPHAWNADATGGLIDSTLENGALAYLGVEFSVERADDCTWNGDACVIDDFVRRWPLLQKPWHGEPKGLVWPRSKRLEAIRAHDVAMFDAAVAEES